jgi:hypothetical protein
MCVGFALDANATNATDHPGYDSAPVQLRLGQLPELSAAAAKVPGDFVVSGELSAFLDKDHSMYPSALQQHFTVTVRFSADDSDGRGGNDQAWHFERNLTASAAAPAYQQIGSSSFSANGLRLLPGWAAACRRAGKCR